MPRPPPSRRPPRTRRREVSLVQPVVTSKASGGRQPAVYDRKRLTASRRPPIPAQRVIVAGLGTSRRFVEPSFGEDEPAADPGVRRPTGQRHAVPRAPAGLCHLLLVPDCRGLVQ